jgi:hypothetical protein
MATGDQSGTWGDTTNTNLELIAEAFSYGTQASFGSDADATTTIADGASDPARSLYLKITSGVDLTATRTLTIAPNTVSKIWIIENATSGSQSINISQGSGANVAIPSGDVKVIYTDGAGSGAAVVDAFTDLNTSGTLTATNLAGTLATAAQPNITSLGTLTGLNVAGTPTFDGLTVDGAATIDGGATDNTVLTLDSSTANTYLKITDSNSTNGAFIGATTDDLNFYPNNTLSAKFASGGDISFYNTAGSSQALFWDASAERLGIGTTSPASRLTLKAGDNSYAGGFRIEGTDETTALGITHVNGDNFFSGNGTDDHLVLTGTGNVGIGVTNPTQKLHVKDADYTRIEIEAGTTSHGAILNLGDSSDADYGSITQFASAAGEGGRMRFVAGATETMNLRDGNVGIGTTSPDGTLHVQGTNSGVVVDTSTAYTPVIKASGVLSDLKLSSIGNGGNLVLDAPGTTSIIQMSVNGSERMRIDSSGNVGIGTSSLTGGNTILNLSRTGSGVGCNMQFANSHNGAFYVGLAGNTTGDAILHSADGTAGMAFGTGNTERMRIDSSGNVGIGTTPASGVRLDMRSNAAATIGDFRNASATGFGLYVAAGDTSSQYAFRAADYQNNLLFTVQGDGNVGIGTSAPNAPLTIQTESGTGSKAGLRLNNPFGFADLNTGAEIIFSQDRSSAEDFKMAAIVSGQGSAGSSNEGYLKFFTRNGGTIAEKVRIDASGNLLVGGTAAGVNESCTIDQDGIITIARTSGTGRVMMTFKNGGASVGTITTTASSTTYNTSSDARLKDVTGEARGLEVINELNPVAYNWKVDGKADEGLIAQEVLDIVPNAVSGSEEEMYQMDYSKLVVHLVAGMKEQQTQIEALQSEINLLKGE